MFLENKRYNTSLWRILKLLHKNIKGYKVFLKSCNFVGDQAPAQDSKNALKMSKHCKKYETQMES